MHNSGLPMAARIVSKVSGSAAVIIFIIVCSFVGIISTVSINECEGICIIASYLFMIMFVIASSISIFIMFHNKGIFDFVETKREIIEHRVSGAKTSKGELMPIEPSPKMRALDVTEEPEE